MLCFFFFQAEDGIRDFHVTGVQTCALPISGEPRIQREFAVLRKLLFTRNEETRHEQNDTCVGGLGCGRCRLAAGSMWRWLGCGRSEERRVGKERRWRWSRAD